MSQIRLETVGGLCGAHRLPFAIDVDAYGRDGWVLLRGLLDEQTVSALQAASTELEDSASAIVVDTRVRGVFFEVQSASGRKREPAVAPGALRKITSPSKAEPAFARLRRDPRVMAVVAALGPQNARCVIDQINFKHPRVGTGFPYHQDAGFLHGDAARDLAEFGGVHLVIALDDSDAGNGGFTVLGGTHRSGLVDLTERYDTSTMNDGLFREDDTHCVALRPGDAIAFHPLLAHGSGPNPSTRRRRLATLWYVGSRLT